MNEKMKKPWYKKVWVWVLVVIAVFILIPTGGSDEPVSEEPETTIVDTAATSETTEVEPTESEVVEEVEEVEETEETNNTNEAVISTFSSLIDLNYPNYRYNVYVEEDIIHVDIWQDGLANDLSTLIIYDQLDAWYTLVESTKFCCGEMKELAETMGSDFNVVWTWYDVVDEKDTPFLAVFNDTVMFDMAEEIVKQGD